MAERYIAAWSEADAAQRRVLIERPRAPGASYRDPVMQGEGDEGISAMIGRA